MTARYELYGIYLSGPAYKVALMLSLAHEPFDYVHLNLRAGEHKTDAFRAKSKFGQVPLLVDHSNGQNVVQSMVILDYLEDAHPQPALLPAGALDRAQARLLGRIVDLYVMNSGGAFFRTLFAPSRAAA